MNRVRKEIHRRADNLLRLVQEGSRGGEQGHSTADSSAIISLLPHSGVHAEVKLLSTVIKGHVEETRIFEVKDQEARFKSSRRERERERAREGARWRGERAADSGDNGFS